MSIASEISRLQSAKADIKTSIENKGVSVAANATLDAYPSYIDAISTETTYTCTITSSNITSDQDFYIQYNGITYKNLNDSFTFTPGDTLTCKVISQSGICRVYIDNNEVTAGTTNQTYYYTLLSCDIDIELNYISTGSNINIITKPVDKCILTYGGDKDNVYVMYNETKYYSRGKVFTFTSGDNLYLYVKSSGTKAYISINEIEVVSDTDECEYNLTLPKGDVVIYLRTGATAYIKVNMPVVPSGSIALERHNEYIDVTSYAKARAYTPEGQLFYNRKLTVSTHQEWINSIESCSLGAFARVSFAGSGAELNFSNLKIIETGAFQYAVGTNISSTINFPQVSLVNNYAFTDAFLGHTINLPICSSMAQCAFQSTKVGFVSIPEITSIPHMCFTSAQYLRSVYASKCTTIGPYAFSGIGSSLTGVYVPKVTTIEAYAFTNATAMSDYNFGSSIASIGSNAFSNCHDLVGLSIPECSYIGEYAFAYCWTGLTTIEGPKISTLNSGTFTNCSKLTYASFSLAMVVSTYCFYSCKSLTGVYLPSATLIGNYAFQNCYALSYISLPECTQVNQNSFEKCYSIATIVLPKCTFIGAYAFRSCYNLLSLYLLASTVPACPTAPLSNTPISTNTTSTGGVNGSIFVRASLYDTWKTATGWTAYSSRFVSMTDAEIEAFLNPS